MSKTITSQILVAYAQCPRKAYLLLCTNTRGAPHEYAKILEQQRQINQRKYLDILQQKNAGVPPFTPNKLTGKHKFLINARIEATGLVAGRTDSSRHCARSEHNR